MGDWDTEMAVNGEVNEDPAAEEDSPAEEDPATGDKDTAVASFNAKGSNPSSA